MTLIFLSDASVAQVDRARFFISFTDKNNSPYSFSNPSAFLSARAIQRRVTQNIAYNVLDLPVNPQYIDSVKARGATVYNSSKWHNGVVVSVPDSMTYYAVISLPFVKDITRVKGVNPKSEIKKFETALTTPEMPFRMESVPYASGTHSLDYGSSFNQIHLMYGEFLHDLGYLGEGVQIALLDAGFNSVDVFPAFDSLNAKNQILGTWDFVNNKQNVYDGDNHGQSVLSCIAGNIPGTLVGTAPKASFWLLWTEDASTEHIIEEYNWAAGAEYADSAGADIISTSLGYTTFDSLSVDDSTKIANPYNHTYSEMNGNTCPSSVAADVAASKGLLVLASAGNSGAGWWHYIGAPSDADSVLSVAAVDSNGYHAWFSSWGPSSDGDVKPNVGAKGYQVYVSSWGGGVYPGNGTSFACPVLAGAVACLWQAHPVKTNMQVFDAIQRSANYFSNPNDSLGYGVPDFRLAHQLLQGVPDKKNTGEDLIIYPNPFRDDLRFVYTSPVQRNIVAEVFDGTGRKVFGAERISDGVHSVSLPVPGGLSKGIYFLKITAGERTIIRRAVKM